VTKNLFLTAGSSLGPPLCHTSSHGFDILRTFVLIPAPLKEKKLSQFINRTLILFFPKNTPIMQCNIWKKTFYLTCSSSNKLIFLSWIQVLIWIHWYNCMYFVSSARIRNHNIGWDFCKEHLNSFASRFQQSDFDNLSCTVYNNKNQTKFVCKKICFISEYFLKIL
jgi:hypothetical protein